MAISNSLESCSPGTKTKRLPSLTGFTLLEIVVTIGITLIFTAVLVGYSRESGRQLVLRSTEAKIISLIDRAKTWSRTFPEEAPSGGKLCGYGVVLNKVSGIMFIFRDLVDASVKCADSDKIYAGAGERLHGIINELQFDASALSIDTGGTTFQEIIFIPPDPRIILNRDAGAGFARIVFGVKGEAQKVRIRINNAGQVTSE